MSYNWPIPHPDPVLDEALDIALHYLETTDQAKPEDGTTHTVADAVLSAWLDGARHRIRLANAGIVAVQQAGTKKAVRLESGTWFSVFPRVS